jgi:hypothetical protein
MSPLLLLYCYLKLPGDCHWLPVHALVALLLLKLTGLGYLARLHGLYALLLLLPLLNFYPLPLPLFLSLFYCLHVC